MEIEQGRGTNYEKLIIPLEYDPKIMIWIESLTADAPWREQDSVRPDTIRDDDDDFWIDDTPKITIRGFKDPRTELGQAVQAER